MLSAGKTKLNEISFTHPDKGDMTLTLFVDKITDMMPVTYWYMVVCSGNWDANRGDESRIAEQSITHNPSTWGDKDSYAYVEERAAKLNTKLTEYFGDQGVPETVVEKIEDAIEKLSLFLQGDLPQVQ